MCALSSGQDTPGRIGGTGDGERLAQLGQDRRFATDDLEPGASDATTWPVTPEHWRTRWWVGHRFAQRGDGRGRGIDRPQHGAHPARFERGAAFLTLCPQGTGAAMADACGIQDPQGAISLGTPFLRIQWVIGRTAQGAIGLRSKRRPRKAMRKGWAGPLGWSIDDRRRGLIRWFRLIGRGRLSLMGRSKFSCT